ncbi:mannitol dehydrogenase family protein [Sphaerisporangium sp. NPDC051017]|uniref:mannitol dehydrogenase family protein n=1 Tax=Sphaerisporangium sp. NPDC051017 TaxID=3154636 RepID=UPI0034245514
MTQQNQKTKTSPLSQSALAKVAASHPEVELPGYDRASVRAGIVHFGVGGFHRAHQAVVVDELLKEGSGQEWGIVGVGVLPGDVAMRDALSAQDGLYTLVRKHPDGRVDARVIGSIIDYLFAPDDPERVIELLADPGVRIVSLTITEGGYSFDQVTGAFDSSTPAIQADLAPGAVPQTVFGLVLEALARRRERGIAPFTIMSCDNIQGNGDKARTVFSAFASLRDPEIGRWVIDQVAFPNSMVDRITPVTTDEDRRLVEHEFGITDRWPVVAEPFFQWVLEDRFPGGRPPYDTAGVQLVEDVEPYELMKLRLLNASHQGMAYFGYLSGHRYAHEATADPAIGSFLRDYMDQEATPTLRPVPGVDLDAYKTTLIERFANPAIRDTLARLCAESSDRIPKWLLPVIREQLRAGGDIRRSAAIVASWARYAEGVDEQGEPIYVVDRDADELVRIARTQRENPIAFIANRKYFGDLAEDDRFREVYLEALESLIERGAAATVRALVEDGSRGENARIGD